MREPTRIQIEELRKKVAKMKTRISVLFSKVNKQSRSRNREFNHPHYRTKSRNIGSNENFNGSGSKLRFFHAKFGVKARYRETYNCFKGEKN